MLIIVPLALSLFACGPREIGQGTSYEAHVTPEATSADLLRQPITGMNPIQTRLYWQNHPEVMAMTQRQQADWIQRRFGRVLSPENPEYRAIPRQRSPFRQ